MTLTRHRTTVSDQVWGGLAAYATLQQYMDGVSQDTKRLAETYAKTFKKRNKGIAFSSATPPGDGVALMRHGFPR